MAYDPNKTAFYVLEQDDTWLTFNAPTIEKKLLLTFLSPATAKNFVTKRSIKDVQLIAIAAKEVQLVIDSMQANGIEGAAIDMDAPNFDGTPHPISVLAQYRGI